MSSSSFSLLAKRSYGTRTHVMPRTFKAHKPPARPTDPLTIATTTKTLDDGELTFIHRSPPTAPTPHSTTVAPASPLLKPPNATKGEVRLPPLLRPSAYVRPPGRLSDEKLAEMQRLRASNPDKYTRGKLASMFGCTSHFVALKAALPPSERKKKVQAFLEEREGMKESWGHGKKLIREIAAKRKTFW